MKNLFKSLILMLLPISAFAGGVSGGGGGLKPANPVDSLDVIVAVAEARKYVAFYANYLEDTRIYEQYWLNHMDLPGKLYDGEFSITQWIVAVPITLKEDGPCLDPQGNENDGSAIASPPAICLSKPRLMEKLSKENVRNQIMALVLHEYSHLAGATEEEADFLQGKAIQDLLNASFWDIDQRLKKAGDSILLIKMMSMPEIWDGAEVNQKMWREFSESLGRINQGFYFDVATSPPEITLSLWDSRMQNLFPQTSIRMGLIREGMCVLGKGKDWRKCKSSQDKIFQRDREIDYHTYMLRSGHKPGEFAERPGLVFRRVQGLDDAKLELPRLAVEGDVYYHYMQVMNDQQEASAR